MFIKRYSFTKHTPILHITIFLIPILFVAIGIFVADNLRTKSNLAALQISLQTYGHTISTVEMESNDDDESMRYVNICFIETQMLL